MAPRGGYSRNRARGVEYVPVSEVLDAEGKIMAAKMGLEFSVWVADAINHHIYRCEVMECKQQWHMDEMAARQRNDGYVDPEDPKYQPRRAKPTISKPKQAGGHRTTDGPDFRR